MEILEKCSQILETYRGHDQVLALFGYSTSMLSGLYPENSVKRQKFQTFSSQVSNCRTILRLLDDFSMLYWSISYGLGKQEKNLLSRILNIISNIASQFYYPFEHIAWFADNKIINIDSGKYWVYSILAWLISSLATFIATFINLRKSLKTKKDESQSKHDKRSIKLNKTEVKMILTMIKEFNFIILAVYWLPPGILWSGKLSKFTSGLLGTIAILSNIIRMSC